MPIPDYQSIMLPLLKHLGDGKVRSTQETLDVLAEKFDLSEEERKELLPSGQQPIFTNRVGWAKLYLRKAGLIEASERGQYKITYEGLNVLRQNPDRIDNRFLSKYPGFIEFTRGRKSEKSNQKKTETIEEEISNDKTPDEYLEYGYQKLRSDLANALIERIKDCPPAFFEKLVIELLLKMGYGGS
ncbi:MAG: winged helix-turn-helix domain-containing protein, partial [bacterium]